MSKSKDILLKVYCWGGAALIICSLLFWTVYTVIGIGIVHATPSRTAIVASQYEKYLNECVEDGKKEYECVVMLKGVR